MSSSSCVEIRKGYQRKGIRTCKIFFAPLTPWINHTNDQPMFIWNSIYSRVCVYMTIWWWDTYITKKTNCYLAVYRVKGGPVFQHMLIHIHKQLFYGHYTGQPLLAGTQFDKWKILLSAWPCWRQLYLDYVEYTSSPQWCYLHHLHTGNGSYKLVVGQNYRSHYNFLFKWNTCLHSTVHSYLKMGQLLQKNIYIVINSVKTLKRKVNYYTVRVMLCDTQNSPRLGVAAGTLMGTTILRTRYSERRPCGGRSRFFSSSVVVMSKSVVTVFVPPGGTWALISSQRMHAHNTRSCTAAPAMLSRVWVLYFHAVRKNGRGQGYGQPTLVILHA